MSVIALLFILCLKLFLISCQSQCRNFQTCSGCISYGAEKCVWCTQKDHIGRRCQSKTLLDPTWCKEVYDPIEQVITTINKSLDDSIQFMPQEIKIKARTKVPIVINMVYKPVDYPLDVYYLIDSSESMSKYKEKLYQFGVDIYNKLSKMSNSVRLGVGSFVEKPALPFVNVERQTAYSFQHHQKITNNVSLFSKALKDLQKVHGSNNDGPQADLDALLQAMVCTEKIGWNPDAHRIILLSTDNTYHNALDGKFVGAINPPRMDCQLDENEYKSALKYDYPSVGLINKVATKTNTMIIFAANTTTENDYKALETKIKNARYVPLLEESDVVEMISEEYKKLVRSVQIHANIEPFMSLTLEPDCTIKDRCIYANNESVNIVGTLIFNSCPLNHKYNYDVRLGPASIKEKLKLDIEVDCQCDCEKPEKAEKNSDQCSNAGTYQCGICECNENRYGDICDCKETRTLDLEKCKANTDDLNPCSDRGICSCGKCIDCEIGFSGDFCEFNDNSCPRPGGVLCSGRGECIYGACQCDPHWLPDDCLCPDNNNTCVAPLAKEPCSGRGNCVCGKCVCDDSKMNKDNCLGTYCDECANTPAERCAELQDFAYCNFKENKTYCDVKFSFKNTDVVLSSKALMTSDDWYMAKMWCRQVLDDGKILVFRYHYPKSATSSTLRLIIQNELDLPPVAQVWVTVGSVVGAMLLIGIITIVAWKFLVDLHDKREYEKFKNDSLAAGYDVHNPLYQPPETSFPNPAYKREHCD
ncbi:jg6382 [Pararge aegeria aegeria]|uniref:Integrin beta n=1 Tax=Pararge aegeria aegeria TaxID=348720 RepID=A0A8S4RTG1_9NEOP|nr:jg6382 [Pararge aegeria aegeria]